MHDVIVIGAGPAGSEVAYRLASLGHDVLVLEKDRLDREKPCGGAIQGVEIEEFGRPPSNVVEKEIHSARLYDCKGNSLLVPLKPYGVSVRRGKYDRWLQTRAEKEGAKFQENTEVKRVRLGKFPEVQTSDESKICKFIVDASGANDIIRRSTGAETERNEYGVAVQKWISLSDSEIEDRFGNSFESYFDSSIVPMGYAWIFPKKDVVVAGLITTVEMARSRRINLKQLLQNFIEKHPIAKRKLRDGSNVLFQSAIVPMEIQSPLHFKNALLVGDAAGLVNPLHGGGIYPARLSAKFAAKFAHKYLQDSKGIVLEEYDKIIQKSMWDSAYKWDTLMRSFFFDDRLFSNAVNDFREKKAVPKLIGKSLMVFKHREIYKQLTKHIARTFYRAYPLTFSDSDKFVKIPEDFDLKEYSEADPSRVLVVAPYCLKKLECPLGRFSESCDPDCNLCDFSSIFLSSKSKGVGFKVEMEGTTSFLDYLSEHYDEYDHLIALSCPYVANKAGYVVHKIFGISGVVIPLKGDVCKSRNKYVKGMKGEKLNQTKTDLQTFFDIMERIRTMEK